MGLSWSKQLSLSLLEYDTQKATWFPEEVGPAQSIKGLPLMMVVIISS